MKLSISSALIALSLGTQQNIAYKNHHAAYYSHEQNMKISAIEKVIEMLKDMYEKGQAALVTEKEQYNTYFLFCRDTMKDKDYQISDGKATIEDAEGTVKVSTSRAESLDKRIEKNDAQIARNNQDLHNADLVRQKENGIFVATNQDYSESLDAIDRAITTLKAQNYDRAQAALIEVSSSKNIDVNDRNRLSAFLDQAPQANAYEASSGGIIEMLENLKDKFIAERTSIQKAEANARHNFEMFSQDLTNDTKDREDENGQLHIDSQREKENAAAADKLRIDTEATLKSDMEYRANLAATCAKKASDFERRSELRTQELEAIKKATDILSSDDVSGAAERHGIRPEPPTSFTQLNFLRGFVYDADMSKAEKFLQDRSKELHSTVLSSLVMNIGQIKASEPHPFDKVIQMVEQLIAKLQQQAKEEASQEAWCDKNLKLNEQNRNQFTKDVNTNQADVDKHGSLVAQRTKNIKDTEQAIGELSTALASATSQRASEKAENEKTIADAKAAQTAVSNAIVVLQEFYGKAATSTSLLSSKQEPANRNPEAPAIFDAPYTGMAAENGGVVSMLQVIQSDFARLEAETTGAEKNAADEFDTFRETTEKDLAVKKKSVEHLTQARNYDRQNLKQSEQALADSNSQLTAAKETFEKLKPPCIRGPIDYEARVRAREAEIKSLREALEILEREKE